MKGELKQWNVACPKCARVLMTQPVSVVEYRDPNFSCKFCDSKGELIANQLGKAALR